MNDPNEWHHPLSNLRYCNRICGWAWQHYGCVIHARWIEQRTSRIRNARGPTVFSAAKLALACSKFLRWDFGSCVRARTVTRRLHSVAASFCCVFLKLCMISAEEGNVTAQRHFESNTQENIKGSHKRTWSHWLSLTYHKVAWFVYNIIQILPFKPYERNGNNSIIRWH
jgi:hypothetical protein